MNPLIPKLRALGDLFGHYYGNPDWNLMCSQLDEALSKPAPRIMSVKNESRKWEIVSAYQKSVRRGQLEFSLKLVSAMESLEGERAYMWKRICTTAAEDIGAGNPMVMTFVVAASSVFTPSTTSGEETRAIWNYLTRIMCLSAKSRLYCQYSIMEGAVRDKDRVYTCFDNPGIGQKMKSLLLPPLSATGVGGAIGAAEDWLIKANWRAEGMTVGPILHSRLVEYGALEGVDAKFPEPVMIKGLPEFAYDKHTQIGGRVLLQLCGFPICKKLFNEFKPIDKKEALGWAMFFEEGGLIQDEYVNMPVAVFEQEVVAERHGLTLEGWAMTREVMRQVLEDGTITQLRKQVLEGKGY